MAFDLLPTERGKKGQGFTWDGLSFTVPLTTFIERKGDQLMENAFALLRNVC